MSYTSPASSGGGNIATVYDRTVAEIIQLEGQTAPNTLTTQVDITSGSGILNLLHSNNSSASYRVTFKVTIDGAVVIDQELSGDDLMFCIGEGKAIPPLTFENSLKIETNHTNVAYFDCTVRVFK